MANRATRRSFMKKGNVERFMAVHGQKDREDINYRATSDTISIAMLVLQDKFDFTPDDLKKFFAEIVSTTECINSGKTNIKEIQQLLHTECGFHLKGEKKQ